MLKGPGSCTQGRTSAALFRNPHDGLSSICQPNAADSTGKIYATQKPTSMPRECGRFVRASSSEMTIPTGRPMMVTRNQMRNEFQRDLKTPGVCHAALQFDRPQCADPARMSGAVLKLKMSNNTIG